MSRISLNITGDIFLGRRLELPAIERPYSLFDKDILQIFKSADLNIVNLESPLTNCSNANKIVKTGPHLKAKPEVIGALKAINVSVATLANNHIYDFGQKGLSDTLEACRVNNIRTVGAGISFSEASKIFYTNISNTRIAIVNIAENEWCNAGEDHGGANPLHIIANVKSIHEAKSNADIILLIIHGGHEFYSYPSPRMVELYRFYAEQGASIVICHHSHCISGYEIYNGVPIFYGLGNFLFDAEINFEQWFEGIFLSVDIDAENKISWTVHPYRQCGTNLMVELLHGKEKSEVENKITAINTIIGDPQKLREQFSYFIKSQKKPVLSMFSTSNFINNRYFRSAIRKAGMERFFLRKAQLRSILNYVRCEAHRDITLDVLYNYLTENEKNNS